MSKILIASSNEDLLRAYHLQTAGGDQLHIQREDDIKQNIVIEINLDQRLESQGIVTL